MKSTKLLETTLREFPLASRFFLIHLIIRLSSSSLYSFICVSSKEATQPRDCFTASLNLHLITTSPFRPHRFSLQLFRLFIFLYSYFLINLVFTTAIV